MMIMMMIPIRMMIIINLYTAPLCGKDKENSLVRYIIYLLFCSDVVFILCFASTIIVPVCLMGGCLGSIESPDTV